MTLSIRAKPLMPDGDGIIRPPVADAAGAAAPRSPDVGLPAGAAALPPATAPGRQPHGARPTLAEPLPAAFSAVARAGLRAGIESARTTAADDIDGVVSMLSACAAEALHRADGAPGDEPAHASRAEQAAFRSAGASLAAALAAGAFPIGGSTSPAGGVDSGEAVRVHGVACGEIVAGVAALDRSDAELARRHNQST